MFKLRMVDRQEPLRKVSLLGVGGGGCRVISNLKVESGGPAVAVLDTNIQSLKESGVMTKIQLGVEDAGGDGTGGSYELGRLAAEHAVELVRRFLSDSDLVVIVSCLGGGTGSGAVPVIAKAAREIGIFTIVLVTRPFEFEGEQRKSIAETGLQAVASVADVTCVIENRHLFDAVGGADLKASFRRSDNMLADGVSGIWQMLVQPSFMGVDLADLRGLVADTGGICLFGFGNGCGETRGVAVAKELLKGPVFDEGHALRVAGAAVVCVVGSQDIRLNEVGDLMGELAQVVPKECNLVMGSVVNDAWADRIQLLVFVTDRKRIVTSRPAAATGAAPAKGRKKKSVARQDKLKLEARGKGRFKDVEATLMDGQNLDIPTYVRLGIKLKK